MGERDYCFEMEMSPSSAPSTSTSPTGIFLEFKLELITDAYGGETSWEVVNIDKNAVVGFNENYASNNAFRETYFFPGDVCYEFTISDSGGNGSCCGYGRGGFTVSYDNIIVGTGGDFLSYDSFVFGNCLAPSAMISAKPSLVPSLEPSVQV